MRCSPVRSSWRARQRSLLVLVCTLSIAARCSKSQHVCRNGVCSSYDDYDPKGWKHLSDDELHILGLNLSYCNIEKVSVATLTAEHFGKHYRNKKPLIIRGLTDNWSAMQDWDLATFVERFGETPVQTDLPFIFETDGASAQIQLLKEYIKGDMHATPFADIQASLNIYSEDQLGEQKHQDTTNPDNADSTEAVFHRPGPPPELQYVFHNFASGSWPAVELASPTPDLFTFMSESPQGMLNQLAVGGSGTGLFFHSHEEAWNAVIRGRKLWVLHSPLALQLRPDLQDRDNPRYGHNAGTFHREFHRQHRLDPTVAGLYECTVEEGEVLYVPRFWDHATINIGDVVARSARIKPEDIFSRKSKFTAGAISWEPSSLRFVVNGTRPVTISEMLSKEPLHMICDTVEAANEWDPDLSAVAATELALISKLSDALSNPQSPNGDYSLDDRYTQAEVMATEDHVSQLIEHESILLQCLERADYPTTSEDEAI